jgi:uncharacterized damage-inducible protein DinB
MNVSELLADALDRVHEQVPGIVEGLSDDDLAWRPDPDTNSIAWLVWHVTRVEDDHVADVAGTGQVWTDDGWAQRLGLPFPVEAHGYGHSSDDVARVRASADVLAGYARAVAERTASYVATLGEADLDRIVDTRWDPPVTLGARLVSVVNEVNQHVGQAAFLRGMLERR